jgi:hypothetical protein
MTRQFWLVRWCSLSLCWFAVIAWSSCAKAPTVEEKKTEVKATDFMNLSDEEFQKYLEKKDPNFKKEVQNLDDQMKKELGTRGKRSQPPPPGWNLEDALVKNDNRPKVYRWLDENKDIRITQEPPPKGMLILGWRYVDTTTPTPGSGHDKAPATSVSPPTGSAASSQSPLATTAKPTASSDETTPEPSQKRPQPTPGDDGEEQ